ncbi:MAG: preprotein translocase subunit YajC [Planctomycetota bacterium]|jgi:preprotein translocase subunit YajC
MNSIYSLLAQGGATPGGGGPGGGAPGGGPGMTLFMALLFGMMVFMVLSQISRARRERKERENLHSSLTKNVRVMTIGGIYGTIVNVKENEVVLKVDESSNTKMTFRKSAISQVVTE